jgi:hypothetical protein
LESIILEPPSDQYLVCNPKSYVLQCQRDKKQTIVHCRSIGSGGNFSGTWLAMDIRYTRHPWFFNMDGYTAVPQRNPPIIGR